MDLKTAFLQGEAYDQNRDIICQIPPEMGYPPHIGARMKNPAYGLNDAPRRFSEMKSPNTFNLEGAVDYLINPVSGNNAKN